MHILALNNRVYLVSQLTAKRHCKLEFNLFYLHKEVTCLGEGVRAVHKNLQTVKVEGEGEAEGEGRHSCFLLWGG